MLHPQALRMQVLSIESKTSEIWSDASLVYSKWFEPRSISSSYIVIVRVRVVLRRTVVGD